MFYAMLQKRIYFRNFGVYCLKFVVNGYFRILVKKGMAGRIAMPVASI